jgi:DNA-binding HxlR family transcriptional regulator
LEPGISDVHADCRAIGEVLSRIGDKWTILVVGLLSHGPARFNEIRRTIGGISQRMLTLTVRGLERDGLVTRTVYPTIPPRVEYALTPLGRTLIDPLVTLNAWAMKHRPTVEKARAKFDGAQTKKVGAASARRLRPPPSTPARVPPANRPG